MLYAGVIANFRPALATTIAVTLAVSGCAHWLVLHPSQQPEPVGDQVRRAVPGPTGPLEIWVEPAPASVSPALYVISFVGNASRAERPGICRRARWPSEAVEVWSVNYPGFGGSAGDATLPAVERAAVFAHAAIRAEARGRPIIVCGNSIGTAAALRLADRLDVAGLVLRNPPPLAALITERHGWWNLWIAATLVVMQIPPGLDALQTARRARAPAVMLTSTDDRVVPSEFQQRVADAYAGPLRRVMMPGAGHNSPLGRHAPAVDAALAWLHEIAVLDTSP